MPALEEKELVTFSAFQGKVDGNTVKGVSIIQEGPALGHGVWVDKTTLSQVKKCAAGRRLKAKQNHWSGIQDTLGYYENFRISGGKLLADLTMLENFQGRELFLEMIEKMPSEFGISISFTREAPEYDEKADRYNARCRELYSADFVDTPAANRDGVFEAEIDKPVEDMPAITAEAFDAYKAEAEKKQADAIAALKAEFETQLAALAAKPVETPEQPKPTAVEPLTSEALAEKVQEAVTTALKVHFAAPTTNTPPADPSEAAGGDPNVKTYAAFKALPHAERNAFMAAGGKLKD
jgi:hypothetical protein